MVSSTVPSQHQTYHPSLSIRSSPTQQKSTPTGGLGSSSSKNSTTATSPNTLSHSITSSGGHGETSTVCSSLSPTAGSIHSPSSTSYKSPSSQSLSQSPTGQTFIPNRQRSSGGKLHPLVKGETFLFCDVCAVTQASADFSHLKCQHLFCKGCWELHFECQIMQGLSTSKSGFSTNSFFISN